jgi:hypothetical protein
LLGQVRYQITDGRDDQRAGSEGPPVTCAETAGGVRVKEIKPREKRVNIGEKREPPASPSSTPRFTLNILVQKNHYSLIVEGWMQGKPCRVTNYTGVFVTIA